MPLTMSCRFRHIPEFIWTLRHHLLCFTWNYVALYILYALTRSTLSVPKYGNSGRATLIVHSRYHCRCWARWWNDTAAPDGATSSYGRVSSSGNHFV